MSYIEKVLSRLDIPGLILLIAGSVAVIAADRIGQMIRPEEKDKVSLIIKAAGGAAALFGALILLDFIG